MPADDADHRGRQTARDEIIERALPRLERLPAAEVQGEQLFLAIGSDGHHTQHGHADDLPGALHPQRDRVEVHPEDTQPGQQAATPGLQLALERAHDPGDGALRKRRRCHGRWGNFGHSRWGK
jgi:hypothetical protein